MLRWQAYFVVFLKKNELPNRTGVLGAQPVLDEEYAITTFPASSAGHVGANTQPNPTDVDANHDAVLPDYQANIGAVPHIRPGSVAVTPQLVAATPQPFPDTAVVVPPFVPQSSGSTGSVEPEKSASRPAGVQGTEAAGGSAASEATPPPYPSKN